MSSLPLLCEQVEPFVELVQLAVPSQRRFFRRAFQSRSRLENTHAGSIQRPALRQRKYQGQPQTQMHSFEHTIIPVANHLRENFVQRPLEQVKPFPFGLVSQYLIDRCRQNIAERLRSLYGLGGVLRDILQHRPQVNTRPPIDVAEIVQKHVWLKIATYGVVARKPRKPRSRLVALLYSHRPRVAARHTRQRKAVPAHGAFPTASGTRMLPKNRRTAPMQCVAPTPLNKRSQQASHRRQIHRQRQPILTDPHLQHVCQDMTQPSPLRTSGVHSQDSRFVKSFHLILPTIPRIAFSVEKRIPFFNEITEICPKSLFEFSRGQILAKGIIHLCVFQLRRCRKPSQCPSPALGHWLLPRMPRIRTSRAFIRIAWRRRPARHRRSRARIRRRVRRAHGAFCAYARSFAALVVRIGNVVALAASDLIRKHASQAGTARSNTKPMKMRTAARTSLETRHAQVRLRLGLRQHCGHHDFHGEFRPQSVHPSNDVRGRAHEVEPNVRKSILETPDRLLAQRRSHVEPVDLVQGIVLEILRPPHRGHPAVTPQVLHAMLLRNQALHGISFTRPW